MVNCSPRHVPVAVALARPFSSSQPIFPATPVTISVSVPPKTATTLPSENSTTPNSSAGKRPVSGAARFSATIWRAVSMALAILPPAGRAGAASPASIVPSILIVGLMKRACENSTSPPKAASTDSSISTRSAVIAGALPGSDSVTPVRFACRSGHTLISVAAAIATSSPLHSLISCAMRSRTSRVEAT